MMMMLMGKDSKSYVQPQRWTWRAAVCPFLLTVSTTRGWTSPVRGAGHSIVVDTAPTRIRSLRVSLFKAVFDSRIYHQRHDAQWALPLSRPLAASMQDDEDDCTSTKGDFHASWQTQQQQQQDDPNHHQQQQQQQQVAKIKGDQLRNQTGIRPSLHPVTINAIAEVLHLRAKRIPDMPLRPIKNQNNNTTVLVVTPLQIALTAGSITAAAIERRQKSSTGDGMTLTAFEQQTIAGRVVGVVMRLQTLEKQLVTKCSCVPWIAKYAEWDSFGILANESVYNNNNKNNNNNDDSYHSVVDDRILHDPLFAMNRAECLLALFLHHVEAPQLDQIRMQSSSTSEEAAIVPDGSIIDFLDHDRAKVLLDEGKK